MLLAAAGCSAPPVIAPAAATTATASTPTSATTSATTAATTAVTPATTSPTVVDAALCGRWLAGARQRLEQGGVDMARRAGPTLRELGNDEARACGALPTALVDAAANAADATGPARLATLQAAGLAALPASCASSSSLSSSAALWQACPPPAPLAGVADGLVRDLAVGEVAYALAVAQALHAHGLLARDDGERLVSTLLLSLALARSG